MKEKFLNKSISNIKKKFPEYSEDKLDEISYGLEAIYLTLTKTVFIFTVAFILHIFKEMLILMILYNILRTTAFGMHAKKSWHCLFLSTSMFIGGALLIKYININIYIKLIISFISFICMIIYAPADTYKRPLINKKKRKIYKMLSIIISLIYIILIICFRNNVISNYLMLGLLESTLMIHPLTYRMFHLPYANYKTYKNC